MQTPLAGLQCQHPATGIENLLWRFSGSSGWFKPRRLPFATLLPQDQVEQVLREENVSWSERLYTPLVTLWVFLSQVLDQDHSMRQAVARFIAQRLCNGQQPCSADTGAYAKARQRLPERVLTRA